MERHSSVNIQELGSLYTEHELYKNDTMTFRRWHRLEPTPFMLCIFCLMGKEQITSSSDIIHHTIEFPVNIH